MVHRDLKPANIFVVGEARDVLVGDFGLLKSLDVDDLTASNERIGTPAYMSPEQYKGVRVDVRSDIYQTGVLLFRLLTGKVPFDDENFFRLGMKHMTRRPPSPRGLNPEIPEALEKVILRCLEKRPKARYPDAGALIRDLNRYLVRKELGTESLSLSGLEEDSGETLSLDDVRKPSSPSLSASADIAPMGTLSRLGSEQDGLLARLLGRGLPLSGRGSREEAHTAAARELFWGLGTMILAGLCIWIGVSPGGSLLGIPRVWVAVGCEALLVLRAIMHFHGSRRLPPLLAWVGGFAVINFLLLFPTLFGGANLYSLIASEAHLLRRAPFAYLFPLQAPFTFGRSVLIPGLSLLFLSASARSLQDPEGGPVAVRELCDFSLAVALLFALSRCSLLVSAGGSSWH
jgi:hypothetical protein